MLPWIDALRGLAILMVLANHVALAVPGLSGPVAALAAFGQMGVQLFFVASAYTLCLSWQQRRPGEPQPVLRFAVRRLFRIAPLYALGIAIFAGLHFAQAAPGESGAYSAANVAANLLFVHGFVPAAQNSVVPGGWSIGVEMAFYALFPALMALQARWPGVRAPLLGAAAALAVNLGVQAAAGETVANNAFAYFHPLNQLPVFLIGMALFEWHRSAPATAIHATSAVGLAALLLTALLWRSGAALAFAIVPTTASLAFAALAHAAREVLSALAGQRPTAATPWAVLARGLLGALLTMGRLSFAVYIVHVLFAWHALRPLVQAGGWQGDAAYLLALAAVTLLSCAAAQGLARWVEQPGIALGRQLLAALPRPAGAPAR